MAVITGTNGNDTLTGTGLADRIIPLLGSDVVDGGGGFDTLVVDYSTGSLSSTSIHSDGGSFYGTAWSNVGDVSFSNVESIQLTLGAEDSYLWLDGGALAYGAQVDLNGGDGHDTLIADFSALADVNFKVSADGQIKSNLGDFSGFETFHLTLGTGTNKLVLGAGDDVVWGQDGDDNVSGGAGNDMLLMGGGINKIVGGAGDDTITSSGVDTVDGGEGFDDWRGDYTAAAANLTVIYSGGAGSVSNGTTFKNLENTEVRTGSGNDSFTVTGFGQILLDGSGGTDTLSIDYSNETDGSQISLFASGNAFLGYIYTPGTSSIVANMENVTFKGGSGDDSIYADATPLLTGSLLDLDGGEGRDTLELNLSAMTDTVFEVDSAGLVTSNIGASIANFENYTLTIGSGNNQVTTRGGNDAVYSHGGTSIVDLGGGDDYAGSFMSVDTVDGGDGYDWWHGGYDEATNDLSFSFDGSVGSLSNGTTVEDFEKITLVTGSGNDSFSLTVPAEIFLTAGSGFDTLHADFSGGGTDPETIYLGSHDDGSISGTPPHGGSFDGFEDVTYIAGDGDSTVYLNMMPLSPGAQLTADGGLGSDVAILYNSADIDVIIDVDNAGTLTSDSGLTLRNFEGFAITLSGGNDNVTTGTHDDYIDAGAGDDIIDGGGGSDGMFGNAGADRFVFDELSDFQGGGGIDWVQDLSSADGDKIDLSGLLPDEAFSFIGTGAFSADGSSNELRYEDVGGGFLFVQGDIGGDGVLDFQLLVTAPSLSGSDFFL